MPRSEGWNTPPPVVRTFRPGATVCRLGRLVTPAAASCWLLTAVITIGTRWRFSARRCAVTTISPTSVPESGAAAGAACALADGSLAGAV